jgi:hypothetical protein
MQETNFFLRVSSKERKKERRKEKKKKRKKEKRGKKKLIRLASLCRKKGLKVRIKLIENLFVFAVCSKCKLNSKRPEWFLKSDSKFETYI